MRNKTHIVLKNTFKYLNNKKIIYIFRMKKYMALLQYFKKRLYKYLFVYLLNNYRKPLILSSRLCSFFLFYKIKNYWKLNIFLFILLLVIFQGKNCFNLYVFRAHTFLSDTLINNMLHININWCEYTFGRTAFVNYSPIFVRSQLPILLFPFVKQWVTQ